MKSFKVLKIRVVVYFAVFFLECLVGIVANSDFSWIPSEVRTTSQQCQDRGNGGDCIGTFRDGNIHRMCATLPCAKADNGNYKMVLTNQPDEGTLCGPSRVCHNRQCVGIPKLKQPKYVGRHDTFPCEDFTPNISRTSDSKTIPHG